MFGFGKKKAATQKATDLLSYTLEVIGSMTGLDPLRLPQDLTDEILKLAMIESRSMNNKYDFCANYMVAFLMVLVGLSKNDKSWTDRGNKVLFAAIEYTESHEHKMSEDTFNQCLLVFDEFNG